jgi:trk system potassium uptake protein TrkH
MGLNLAETVLLCLGGMSVFDSLCHAFGTVSTSGYSPWNASIGHYNNPYFDWIIILFMFLGGMTFVLFLPDDHGEIGIRVRINTEFRWYIALMLFFCGIVSWISYGRKTPTD